MGFIKWWTFNNFNNNVSCEKVGAIYMIYQLIYDELIQFINSGISWQVFGIEILSYTLTILFILFFIFLPLYLFNVIVKFIDLNENNVPRRKRKRRGWN